MSAETIETDAALAKLGRSLDVDPAELDFLADLDAPDLRRICNAVDDHLGARDVHRLQGVMNASKLVPMGLAATIGERWFGPVLCARLVGLVEPKRARQYVRHLSVGFMADITTRTDPRVVGDLVHELPVRSMQAIAQELLERDDHLTLSHFVGHIPADIVARVLEAIDDHAAVVRIARYVEDLSHLDPVVALLPDQRVIDLVSAVDREDLWVDGFHLFSQLGEAQITRIATTIIHLDTAAVSSAIEAFDRHDLWEQGIDLVEHLDARDVAPFADALLVLDDATIDHAVAAIDRYGSWPILVDVALATDTLGADVRARLRELVDRLDPGLLQSFEKAAADRGHPALLASVLG